MSVSVAGTDKYFARQEKARQVKEVQKKATNKSDAGLVYGTKKTTIIPSKKKAKKPTPKKNPL